MSLLLLFLNDDAAVVAAPPAPDPNATLWLILFASASQKIERE